MNFELTVTWENSPSITVRKEFKTKSANRGWGFAKRWTENCLAICGKDDKGEQATSWELKRLNFN